MVRFRTVILAILLMLSCTGYAQHFDFDGDGIDDLAFRDPVTGFQYFRNSSDTGFNSVLLDRLQRMRLASKDGDIPVTGDFDGDGIAEVALRRPETFEWFIYQSSTGDIRTVVFGRDRHDIPVPADYDGDGKTDIATWRPATGTWYIKNSSGSNFNSQKQDGIQRVVFGRRASDIPVPADYDGDGKADLAFRRPDNFTWYIKNSSGSNFNSTRNDGIQRIVFGRSRHDIPVPADYDGDGKADVAVRRPSNFTWYIKNSSGSDYNSAHKDGIQRIVFGKNSTDIPVPADYDGDGKADLAVRRLSNETFYIKNSSLSNFDSERQDGIQRINFRDAISENEYLSDGGYHLPLAASIHRRMHMAAQSPALLVPDILIEQSGEGDIYHPSLPYSDIDYRLTIVPAPGFRLDSISGCQGLLNGNIFNINQRKQSCKLTVSFIENEQSIEGKSTSGALRTLVTWIRFPDSDIDLDSNLARSRHLFINGRHSLNHFIVDNSAANSPPFRLPRSDAILAASSSAWARQASSLAASMPFTKPTA